LVYFKCIKHTKSSYINNLDNFFKEIAIKNKKNILLMESPEENLKLFDKIPINENIGILNEIIDDIDKVNNQVLLLSQKYIERDIKSIEEIIFSEEKISKYKEYYRILFFDRNIYWTNRIEEITNSNIDKQFVFILNINNLLGDKGILNQMKNLNYKIELL
jgi:uncharacterized protein YbaP (TraB family)